LGGGGGGGIPTWFIQLQNVNHSRLNLGIRFIFTLFQIRNADHETMGTLSQTQEHTANFSSTPFVKKNGFPQQYDACVNLLKPTGHLMHQQFLTFNNCTLCPTLYLCVLYLSQNKQRLVPLTP
jgi:hypothetical protein